MNSETIKYIFSGHDSFQCRQLWLKKGYDYVQEGKNFNFYSYLASKNNPDLSTCWFIRNSIEELEKVFDLNINDYIKTVKTIGLLNTFSASGSILDLNFFSDYLKSTYDVTYNKDLIKNLEENNIIRSHSKRCILIEGTDLDIQISFIEEGNKILEVVETNAHLINYLGVPLSGRAFRSNLLPFGTKGFPLQSLTQTAA